MVTVYYGFHPILASASYDGAHWKGFFDHDSGLASNFINFVRAEGSVVYICSDKGLSCTDGKSWVTYKKNDNGTDGKAIVKNFGRIDDKTPNKTTTEIQLSPSISHNFIIGVDEEDGVLWVATSKGVSRGELMK